MKSPCSYFQSILLIHFSWIIVLLLCLHGTITNPCFILLFSCFLTIDLFNIIVLVILLGRESIKYMAKIENKTDSSMFYILLSVRKHISIHLLYLLSLQYSERIQSIFCTCCHFSIQRGFNLFSVPAIASVFREYSFFSFLSIGTKFAGIPVNSTISTKIQPTNQPNSTKRMACKYYPLGFSAQTL